MLALVPALVVALALAPDAGVPLAPPRLRQDSPARYPTELRGQGIGGEVRLLLTVDERGDVGEARVLSATDDAFGREALHAAMRLAFEPAQLEGQPRAVQLEFTYRFEAPRPQPPAPRLVALTGLVRSRGTRTPIALARVAADDGASTDTDGAGRFRLELTPGTHSLHATAPGFLDGVWRETLEETRALEVVYGLTPQRVNPFETVVRGEKERTEVSRLSLRDAELREVPGTMGDPFRVVMVLPGVSSLVSGLSYPVVRGSSPSATGTFLDGIRVPELFHVFLGPAVVHPDLLDGLDFYAGGAPVKYGQLVGGVLEGRLARPRDQGLHFTASADLLNVGGLLEVPFPATDTRVTLAGRWSYMGLVVGAVSPLLLGPQGPRLQADFWDYQAKVDQGLWGGRLQLFGFGSSDTFGTHFAAREQTSSTQAITFHRADAKYRHPLGPGELEARLTWGLDLFGLGSDGPIPVPPSPIGPAGPPPYLGRVAQRTAISQATLTAKLGWRGEVSDAVRVAGEASVDSLHAAFSRTQRLEPVGGAPVELATAEPVAAGRFLAGWAEATYRAGASSMTLGLRLDHLHLDPDVEVTTFDPRFSVSREVTERFTARAAVGLFHQPPTFLLSVPIVDLAGVAFGAQEVLQVSCGFTWKLWRELELSLDAYVHPMTRTAELAVFGSDTELTDPVASPSDLVPKGVLSRPGLAYGLDLMLRLPQQGRWFGWVTLSLQRSTRLTTSPAFDGTGRRIGERTEQLPSAFDQTVVANAVGSYRFDSGLSLGATLHFHTGRPESGELGSRTRIPGVGLEGATQWIRVSRDRVDRLPPYFRVDLRVARTWVFDAFTLEAWLDVLNASASGEVLGYDYGYGHDGALLKTPISVPVIVPSLGVKARY